MQQTKFKYTVGDLLSIFGTTRTSLYQRLNKNGLKNKLKAQHHIIKPNSRPYFDNYALIKVANNFIHRRIQKKSKSHSNNRTESKQLSQINHNLKMIKHNQAKIINKLNITY